MTSNSVDIAPPTTPQNFRIDRRHIVPIDGCIDDDGIVDDIDVDSRCLSNEYCDSSI